MILTYSLIHHFITGDSLGEGESQLIGREGKLKTCGGPQLVLAI